MVDRLQGFHGSKGGRHSDPGASRCPAIASRSGRQCGSPWGCRSGCRRTRGRWRLSEARRHRQRQRFRRCERRLAGRALVAEGTRRPGAWLTAACLEAGPNRRLDQPSACGTERMTRVLLADDHPMIASALEMLLRGTDYRLVGRARSGKEALAQIDEVNPDLVLLDVNMPDGTGIDVLRKLRRNGEKRPIVLLTAGLDDPQLIAADDLEPNGVMLKTSDPALLLQCMDQVLEGKTWVDPEIVDRTNAAKQRVSSLPPLTPRERELVELVRQGLRNRDIANRLGVTEGTVKVYLHSIFDKVGVGSRTELAIRASGLIGS